MQTLMNRFFEQNIWVKIIFVFCLFGAFVNFFLVLRDISTDGILLRLHAGFFILYASQAAFILLNERFVCILSVLQGVLALLTNADFTFVPLMRFVGHFYYLFNPTPSVETMTVYKYVFISLAFTLEMLKSYILFVMLPKPAPKKKTPETEPAEAATEALAESK